MLGVKVETLYAYASRGVVTSLRRQGSRVSWFDPVELDQVARRGRSTGRDRLADVQFQSAVTLVEGGRFFYRGWDPLQLIGQRSFEEVACLLWTGEFGPAAWTADERTVAVGRRAVDVLPERASLLDRVRAVVPALAAHDELRVDLRPEGVASRCGDWLAGLVESVAEVDGTMSYAARVGHAIADGPPSAAGSELIEAALVLLADHEVAASTAAVRIAASFHADPYAALGSGLAVLSGAFHGAASVETFRLLREAVESGANAAVAEALQRFGRVPGLGQTLYPDGDPRYPALIGRIEQALPDSTVVSVTREIEQLAAERGFPAPNVDFALGALALSLDLGTRAGESIFAFARMAGWLAHAIEEYAERTDLRLRANYTGRRPDH